MAFLPPENYANLFWIGIYSVSMITSRKTIAGNARTLPEIHEKPPKGHALMYGQHRYSNRIVAHQLQQNGESVMVTRLNTPEGHVKILWEYKLVI